MFLSLLNVLLLAILALSTEPVLRFLSSLGHQVQVILSEQNASNHFVLLGIGFSEGFSYVSRGPLLANIVGSYSIKLAVEIAGGAK